MPAFDELTFAEDRLARARLRLQAAKLTFERAALELGRALEEKEAATEAYRARRPHPCDHSVRRVIEQATTQAALAEARPAWDALRATGWVTQPAPGADRCAEREEGR